MTDTMELGPLPTPPPHLAGGRLHGDSATYMPDVWEHLLEKFRIKSVLDVGCADGYNLRWFFEKGCLVRGVDGWIELVKRSVLPPGKIVCHDFSTGPFDWMVFRPQGYLPEVKSCLQQIYLGKIIFDLCWSSEFVEHVEEKYIPNYLPLFQRCKYLCMTHAVPNQHGDHHVNCQTTDYWVAKLEEAGFAFDSRESRRLRLTDKKEFTYGRSSLLWFYNPQVI